MSHESDLTVKNDIIGYDVFREQTANTLSILSRMAPDVITRCGLKIGHIFIVIHPDEENPFVPVDVTQQAEGYYRWINDNIWDLNRMQKEAEKALVEPGEQCCNPYECRYYGYCHSEPQHKSEWRIFHAESILLQPLHHVQESAEMAE